MFTGIIAGRGSVKSIDQDPDGSARLQLDAGGLAESLASGDFGQNWSMITPWGMYMKPRRTGGLATLPAARAALPRESRKGRARVTPAPLRKLRRSTSERDGGVFMALDGEDLLTISPQFGGG